MLRRLIADVKRAKNALRVVSSCSDNACDKTAQVPSVHR